MKTGRLVSFVVSIIFILSVPAMADLTAYYQFDGTAADSSGNNRNGTASDNGTVGIYWAGGGMVGGAVGFDGDRPANNTNTLARVEIPTAGMAEPLVLRVFAMPSTEH